MCWTVRKFYQNSSFSFLLLALFCFVVSSSSLFSDKNFALGVPRKFLNKNCLSACFFKEVALYEVNTEAFKLGAANCSIVYSIGEWKPVLKWQQKLPV